MSETKNRGVKIKLYGGEYTLIDKADEKKVSKYLWRRHNCGYACRSLPGEKTQLLHRYILNLTNRKIMVDHANHDRLDNRRSNLRICDNALNSANRKTQSNNTTGYKGVYKKFPNGRNPYIALVGYKGRRISAGRHKSPEAAAIAYNIKAREIYGEFAYLNVVIISGENR